MKAKITRYLIPLFILAILITFYFASHSSSSSAKQITEKSTQETAEENSIKEPEEEPAEEPTAEEVTDESKEENLEGPEVEEEKADTNNTTTEQDNSTEETYSKEFYDNIEFSVDIQDVIDGRQKIVVYIKNNNKNYAFSGTVRFYASSIHSDPLCLDYIYLDDIPPGVESWAILWGKPGLYDSYSATISEANFREVPVASNIDYEQIGIRGKTIIIYTEIEELEELQKIADLYKEDIFSHESVFQIWFFNNREQAFRALKNSTFDYEMLVALHTRYNYNENTGYEEIYYDKEEQVFE